MMAKATSMTAEDLVALGASESNIRWLAKPVAASIQYLDLIEPATRHRATVPMAHPGAVIEFEGQPLLYVVDGRGLAGAAAVTRDEIAQTLRILACRGDAAYLAILEYGRVVIHPILLKTKVGKGISWDISKNGPRSLVQDLATETIDGLPARGVRRAAVHDLLFRLLSQAADELLKTQSLKGHHEDVLALIGRALFARFLIDREIMSSATFSDLNDKLENCFATSAQAERTCKRAEDHS